MRPFFTQPKNHPEVVAHRGGDGQWPGQTMYAFKKAMDLKVDVLETDVYLTKDGHLVLMHDNNVKNTTNHEGLDFRIHKFTLAQLKELNAAYKWSPGGTKKRPFSNDANKDLRVTSLKEVFDQFPGMRMNIEMKEAGEMYSPAAKLSEMICETNMQDKVLVASISDSYMQEFRGLCPDVATSASSRELLEFAAGKDSIVEGPSRPDALQMKDSLVIPLVTKKFVERAHRINLPVHAWTVNDLVGMQRLIDCGVDGIITDYPGPLLAMLDRPKET